MRQHTVQTPYVVGEAHFYSTEIGEELVLFDTGPATPEALVCLKAEVDLERLRYLFVTHCHVDHYGLAAYIAQHSTAEICLPRKDAVKMHHHDERLAHIQKLLNDCGFDEGFADRLRSTFAKDKVFPVIPDRFTIVEESAALQKLGIGLLNCPGHSQSDLVYLCGNHAVTGDILLRNIFQAPLLDVDLENFAGRFKNYDAYCTSLVELGKLRGYEIRPGHREYVESLDDTILFYAQKLLERAGEVKKFARVESVRDVIGQLFGNSLMDPFFIYLKASEIIFMRDFLAEPHKLRDSLTRIGLFDSVSELYAVVTD
jgi:hydroxyacylglutathione hydrolase